MMQKFKKVYLAGLAGAAILLVGFSNPAEANPALIMDSQISVSVMALVSSGYCISYIYDQNGNRLSQAVTTFGSTGVTWGSGAYGCFFWAAS